MNLEQAKRISELSDALSDECTWAPEFGVGKYCVMHDHLLQHFVFFRDDLNIDQRLYMHEQGLHELIVWTRSNGKDGEPFTWKMANHLFRQALTKKIEDHRNPIKKVWYWWWRNVYYFGVILWRRLRPLTNKIRQVKGN